MKRRLGIFFATIMMGVSLVSAAPVMAENNDDCTIECEEQCVSENVVAEAEPADDVEGYTATFKLSDEHLFQEGWTGPAEGELETAEDELATAAAAEGFDTTQVIDYLHEKMEAGEMSIDLTGYSIPYEVFAEIADKAINLNPDLYNVSDRYCSYDLESGYVKTMEVAYGTMSDSKYKAAVKKALACTNSSMTKVEKVIAIHDYLVANCEYGYGNYQYTAYGCLVKKKCVCMGYALAFNDLMHELDIDAYYVASNSMNHAWSMVKISGNYYHVDVTWDDPVPDVYGRVGHQYVLLSDSRISDHCCWVVYSDTGVENYKARDKRFDNAVWQSSWSPTIFQDGYCYYAGDSSKTRSSNYSTRGLCRLSRDNYAGEKGEVIYPLKNIVSGLFKLNNRFFFNSTSQVLSVRPDGTDLMVEMEPPEGVYIIGYINGRARYLPSGKSKEEDLKDLHLAGIPPTHVTFSTTDTGVVVGATKELSVNTYPSYAGDTAVIWASEDESIAAIEGSAVRGVSPGTTEVSARCVWEDGTEVKSSMTVTVYEAGKYCDSLWMEDIPESVEYTGKAIKFTDLKVYYGSTRLVAGKEYKVSYRNNKAAGSKDAEAWSAAPTVKIQGKGKYAGSLMRTFTISQKSIEDRDVACDDLVKAFKDGKSYKATPKLFWGNAVIKANNYDLIDEATGLFPEKYALPGVYTLKLIGKGNYTGERRVRFILTEDNSLADAHVRKPLKGFKIAAITTETYNGDEHTPVVTVSNKEAETLTEGDDYFVTYSNNVNAGKATVTVHGIGEYRGTLTKKFVIAPYDISADELGLIRASVQEKSAVRIVNGKATPKALVYFKGQKLRAGIDYSLSYANNKKARDREDENPPMLIIKGKKNFKKNIRIPFSATTMSVK